MHTAQPRHRAGCHDRQGKWNFDPKAGLNSDRQHQTCRGVTYYRDAAAAADAPCAQRIYLPTSDARLIALDAANGQICRSFADNGELHLEQGMKHHPAGYYYSTSPPVIVDNKIIIGGAVMTTIPPPSSPVSSVPSTSTPGH